MKQHEYARQLLPKLQASYNSDKLLTYGDVAKFFGLNPQKSGRAAGQVCDLLDAAACWADIPLLAFRMVRQKNLEYNTRAWAGMSEPRGARESIIRHSEGHRFNEANFKAIKTALDEFAAMKLGNEKAWLKVKQDLGVGVWLRLTGKEYFIPRKEDAVDDLGTDQPPRQGNITTVYVRNPKVRKKVMERAKGKCEFCGKRGFKKSNGDFYLETHHIIALAEDGKDRVGNVIALCANHHREAHFGSDRNSLEEEMKRIVEHF